MQPAAIGLRAKTGRAIAVVLTADSESPAFLWRGMLSLVDPKIPTTAEPYHQVMELPWSEVSVAVQPLVTAIEAATSVALRSLIDDLRSREIQIRTAGIVGAPDRNLARIGNEHIRAHAAEGVLFRRVLEAGAKANHLRHSAFSESDVKAKMSEPNVTAVLKEMGRVAGPPWRTDERLAATAAWMALYNTA